MRKDEFDCKPSLVDSRISKTCEKAFKLTTSLQCARDLCEEYVAARIWPLKKGWSFVRFLRKLWKGKKYLFPDSEVIRCLSMKQMKNLFLC
jgi:hypothetical protein